MGRRVTPHRASGASPVVFRFDNHRLIAHIAYEYFTVYVKWIGTHDEYEEIDPEKVEEY